MTRRHGSSRAVREMGVKTESSLPDVEPGKEVKEAPQERMKPLDKPKPGRWTEAGWPRADLVPLNARDLATGSGDQRGDEPSSLAVDREVNKAD